MKGKPIDQLVFDHMFPSPKPNEPTNFHGFLSKYLVNEVRAETQTFYGGLGSRESQYPGLDYSFGPHRVRLGRFTWHRRLFRAFDSLGLTKNEIASLTKWEGTRWAKERFEKEQGFEIRDTTGDCISDWVPPHLRSSTPMPMVADMEDLDDADAQVEEPEEEDESDLDDDSDMEIDSVGLELNRRLLANAGQETSGQTEEPLVSDFEEWLRKQVEEGTLNSGRPAPIASSLPPRWLNAARLGQWQQLPDAFRDIMRNEWRNGTTGLQEVYTDPAANLQIQRQIQTIHSRAPRRAAFLDLNGASSAGAQNGSSTGRPL